MMDIQLEVSDIEISDLCIQRFLSGLLVGMRCCQEDKYRVQGLNKKRRMLSNCLRILRREFHVECRTERSVKL